MSVLHHEPGPAVRGPGRLARPSAVAAARGHGRRPRSRPCSTTAAAGSSTAIATSSTRCRSSSPCAGWPPCTRGRIGLGWRALIVVGVVVNGDRRLLGVQPAMSDEAAIARSPRGIDASPSSPSSSCPAPPVSCTRSSGRASSSSCSGTRPRPCRPSSTGFFGGMAIGAAVGGRIADRVRSPLRMYGILELRPGRVVLVTPMLVPAHPRGLPRDLPVTRGRRRSCSRSSASSWRSWRWRRRRSSWARRSRA